MWGERESPDISRVIISKGYYVNNLYWFLKTERKFSDKHIYTPLPYKAQPKSEKKYISLPDQNRQNSEITPLHTKTKKLERKYPDKHRYTPIPGKTKPKLEKKYMPLPD